jgi:uridylate kinase
MMAIDYVKLNAPVNAKQNSNASNHVGRVVVLGGLQPGQSTTAVAALCAEYLSYDLVLYCTNIPNVYTDDPKKNPDAKKLENVTYKDLQFLCGLDNSFPGQYQIMDQMALTILERSKMTAVILQGTAENLLSAMKGDNIGTRVSPIRTTS